MESQTVRDAVERRLDELPDDIARSPTAAIALRLAASIDRSDRFRFHAALTGQLRECLAELDAKAPAKDEGDRVDDLNARRAARRRAAAAG